MSTSEIGKLESRWRENPNGLTFAPLAEAYRKQRDPQRAIEILLPGLAKHPDYIPANIVLGRCHWDLEDLPAAEGAFAHVLGLDGENVIALKALADITERLARYDEAERWLTTLLVVDRSNDEAMAQLGRVRELQRQKAEGTAILPEAAEAASPADIASHLDIQEPDSAPPPEEPVTPPEAFEPSPEPALAEEVPPVEYIGWVARPDDSPVAADPVPLADLDGPSGSDASADLGARIDPPAPSAAWTEAPATDPGGAVTDPPAPTFPEGDVFDIEQREDIVLNVTGSTEYQTPSAVEDLVAGISGTPRLGMDDLRRDLAPEHPITSALPGFEPPSPASLFGRSAEFYALDEPPVPGAPGHEQPQAGAAESARASERDPAPESEPAAEFTPAMEPAASDSEPAGESAPAWVSDPVGPAAPVAPGVEAGEFGDAPPVAEPELVVTETMAQVLLRQGHLVEALTVYRELVRRSPSDSQFTERLADLEARQAAAVSPPPQRAFAARDTGGQSVVTFFRELLAERPQVPVPRWPARPEPAAQPEPAPEAGSATRPAGEPLSLGSVFGDEPPPVTPAMRTSGDAAASGNPKTVSFDEFFGSSSSDAAPPVPGRPQGRGGEDLDQFNAWLQSLKR